MNSLPLLLFFLSLLIPLTSGSLQISSSTPCLEPSIFDLTQLTPIACPSVRVSKLHPRELSAKNFQIEFECKASKELCDKAKNAFQKAGSILSSYLDLRASIRVNASLFGFCSNIKQCGNGNTVPIGFTKPSALIPIEDEEGAKRMYPQALVRQLNTSTRYEYTPFDIETIFNSDVKYWFDGDGDIQTNQQDFLMTILHELIHGLGFASGWNDYTKSDSKILTPIPRYEPIEESDKFRVVEFLETAFDRTLTSLQDKKRVTELAKELNGFPNSIANKFSDVNEVYAAIKESKFKDSAQRMYELSTTEKSLGLVLKNSGNGDTLILETALKPFIPSSSLSHMDHKIYSNTRDFLMRYVNDQQKPLDVLVKSVSGTGPLGPQLLDLLEAIGYKVRRNTVISAAHISIQISSTTLGFVFGLIIMLL
ncbi:uncharacterized protein VTP21DRAFT_8360 [Calcarisporiella thermophila]|uniref:uncharacterized protein n=1 Tax=Calcarisporiella thermophila TaxID=911321 RepID=UPI0037440D04